jgi:hypothetical protein
MHFNSRSHLAILTAPIALSCAAVLFTGASAQAVINHPTTSVSQEAPIQGITPTPAQQDELRKMTDTPQEREAFLLCSLICLVREFGAVGGRPGVPAGQG